MLRLRVRGLGAYLKWFGMLELMAVLIKQTLLPLHWW